MVCQIRLKPGEHTFKYFVAEEEGSEEVSQATETVKNLTKKFTTKNIQE